MSNKGLESKVKKFGKILLKESLYALTFPIAYSSYFLIKAFSPRYEVKNTGEKINYYITKVLCTAYKTYLNYAEKNSKLIGGVYKAFKKYNLEELIFPKECKRFENS